MAIIKLNTLFFKTYIYNRSFGSSWLAILYLSQSVKFTQMPIDYTVTQNDTLQINHQLRSNKSLISENFFCNQGLDPLARRWNIYFTSVDP